MKSSLDSDEGENKKLSRQFVEISGLPKRSFIGGKIKMSLPVFKYHPDPLLTGSVQQRNVQCACCGETREYTYAALFTLRLIWTVSFAPGV
jgi:hypothetical protein